MFAYIKFQWNDKICLLSEPAATHLSGWWHYRFAAEIRVSPDRPNGCFFQPPTSNDSAAYISRPMDAACVLRLIITNITKLMLLLTWDWKHVMFDFTISLNILTSHTCTNPILPLEWISNQCEAYRLWSGHGLLVSKHNPACPSTRSFNRSGSSDVALLCLARSLLLVTHH